MSYKKAAVLYGLAVILQLALLNLISVFDITPNLVLCLALFITYKYNDGIRPALIGVPFALLLDIMSGQYAGVGALMIFALCIATAYFGRDLNRDNVWTLFSVIALGTVLYYVGYWMILVILGNPTSILYIIRFLLIEIPFNLLVAAAAYRIQKSKPRPGRARDFGFLNVMGKRKNTVNNRYTR